MEGKVPIQGVPMGGRLPFARWETVGLDLGASVGPRCDGQRVHASSAFCGHSPLASLKTPELCFKERIVCWPLLRSLETQFCKHLGD